jgi:hypothetical protein
MYYLSPVYSPKIYVGHITTESIFHECYMEKWICIYSYSMINSVQSALDTYWNKHPFVAGTSTAICLFFSKACY